MDAGGVAAVVTALQAHPNEVGVQGDGCGALFTNAQGGAAYAQPQAVADADGVAAVEAALQAHPSE